jgi:hypothetical protein
VAEQGGYIVLRGLLSAAEIDEMNAAVDQMTAGQDYTASASYANGSPMMRGTGNVARKVADALGVPDSTLLASAMEAAGYTPADDLRENDSMTLGALEQVLRRLVPPGRDSALSDEEVRAVLAAVPAGEGDATVRLGATRRDIGGLLSWPQPFCEPFRGLLCHPCLQPVLDTILGRGYRLDHGPSIIEMEKGSDGQILHGGAHERFTSGGFMEGFTFHAGHFFTGLTVVEVMLADENPGDGGAQRSPARKGARTRARTRARSASQPRQPATPATPHQRASQPASSRCASRHAEWSDLSGHWLLVAVCIDRPLRRARLAQEQLPVPRRDQGRGALPRVHHRSCREKGRRRDLHRDDHTWQPSLDV